MSIADDEGGRDLKHVEEDARPQIPRKPPPKLDIKKLQSLPSEQQGLRLLNHVTDLESYGNSLSTEEICEEQDALSTEIFQLIELQNPCPSKTICNSIGRVLAHVLEKGNRKILFDALQRLVNLTASKREGPVQNKTVAFHIIGDIYRAAGDSAYNLSGLTCTTLIKQYKIHQPDHGARTAILRAFVHIVISLGSTLEESIARDIWKLARKAAVDERSAGVQIRAFACLQALFESTNFFYTSTCFDELRNAAFKAMDSPVKATSRAAGSCLASYLSRVYVENAQSRHGLKRTKTLKTSASSSALPAETGGVPSLARSDSNANFRGATAKLELSLSDIISFLTAKYTSPSTSNRSRLSLSRCLVHLFRKLGRTVVRLCYQSILKQLSSEVLDNDFINHDRRRQLLARQTFGAILDDCIAGELLIESGRLEAAKSIIKSLLQNHPQISKDTPPTSKYVLISALDSLTHLIKALGPGFCDAIDICQEALFRLASHSSYSVQVHTAHCMQTLVSQCPHVMLGCARKIMDSLRKELDGLDSSTSSVRRCIGLATTLAAIVSISSQQPLYSSLELSVQVLDKATSLLKSSSKADLRIAGAQVQVAWVLLGSLMALGPDFVKIHIAQFLLLWRNALPKSSGKQDLSQRSASEIYYLLCIREYALGSIVMFLRFNHRLVTNDVASRIAKVLSQSHEFVHDLPASKIYDDTPQRLVFSLNAQEIVIMVQRRLYQSCSMLLKVNALVWTELPLQSDIFMSALKALSEPTFTASSSISSSIASDSNTAESILFSADSICFMMTTFDVDHSSLHSYRGGSLSEANRHDRSPVHQGKVCSRSGELMIELTVIQRNLVSAGAYEHDITLLFSQTKHSHADLPSPITTELINNAIDMVSIAYPLQSSSLQQGILAQIASTLNSLLAQRESARRTVTLVNIAHTIWRLVKGCSASEMHQRSTTNDKMVGEILQTLLLNDDETIQRIASEAMGSLCGLAGNIFTSEQVDRLIDIIVSNREPSARSGCALALGSIHICIGGMAAGLHMKKIHGVLMTLCSDPHPIVHHSAIKALSDVANSAGLAFAGMVSSTLGLLAQLWTSDSHNDYSTSLSVSNSEIIQPTSIQIASCTRSLINVLGPDLQEMPKIRDLFLKMMHQFAMDEVREVQAEGLRAWEVMYLYNAAQINFLTYLTKIKEYLTFKDRSLKDIAVDGLYSLVRHDAAGTIQLGGQELEEHIWATISEFPDHKGILSIVQSWLEQTALTATDAWIQRCQQLLTRASFVKDSPTSAPASSKPNGHVELQDEEVAGFNLNDGDTSANDKLPESAQELLCWQARALAMELLNKLVEHVQRDACLNHDSKSRKALQDRVADVIRLGFLASTASVAKLQVSGLRLIDRVLKLFGSTPDPDFVEALLLEQYQAQISSALTPAFAEDSSPEVASAAVDVCATFIAAGLVTDTERMGRIYKLLLTTLREITGDASSASDSTEPSANGKVMLRLSVLSAWADLQIVSVQRPYLVEVVKPHLRELVPLWLSTLHEYAHLKFEPDISDSVGLSRSGESSDLIYAAFNRRTLLKFYQSSWLRFLNAIACLIENDVNFVFDSLTSTSTPNADAHRNGQDINYKNEPAAFFFVLFGIVIEALTSGHSQANGEDNSTLTVDLLSVLRKLLRPSVAGNVMFQGTVFSETVDLLNRVALTTESDAQREVVNIAHGLCMIHPSVTARQKQSPEEHNFDDIEQLFELTRIIVLVLGNTIPNLTEHQIVPISILHEDTIDMVQSSLQSLVDIARIFPQVIQTDLCASITNIFATILGSMACQSNIVPLSLPLFKDFLSRMSELEDSSFNNVIHGCLRRFLRILQIAQRREADASLLCAKNVLLAITIVVTTVPTAVGDDIALLQEALDEVLDCIADLGLGKTALNCLRSLLLLESKHALNRESAAYLFPRIITTILDEGESLRREVSKSLMHILTAFVARQVGGNMAKTAMMVVICTILARHEASGEDFDEEAAEHLLELAAGSLTPIFKDVVKTMNKDQKSLIETILHKARPDGSKTGNDDAAEDDDSSKPSIALKFNFG